jgi:hypothetical protein
VPEMHFFSPGQDTLFFLEEVKIPNIMWWLSNFISVNNDYQEILKGFLSYFRVMSRLVWKIRGQYAQPDSPYITGDTLSFSKSVFNHYRNAVVLGMILSRWTKCWATFTSFKNGGAPSWATVACVIKLESDWTEFGEVISSPWRRAFFVQTKKA